MTPATAADPLPVSLSSLEHYAYCPRQATLILLEDAYADDSNTIRGTLMHAHVHDPGVESRPGVRTLRALPVWHDGVGLIGVCDVVEIFADGTVAPVEHKSGRYQPGGPADVQLAGQAVCLEERLATRIDTGFIYAAGDRKRHPVTIDDALRERVVQTAEAVRSFAQRAELAPAVADNRCRGCSMSTLCMPKVWMSSAGRFLGRVDGPTRGNVLLRHSQHLAHADPEARLSIARSCVAGKIQNSRQILMRGARDSVHRQQALREISDDLADLLQKLPEIPHLEVLLGIEGQAARLYFSGLRHLLRPDLGLAFTARIKRPAIDPVNALLSFLYGLLRSAVHGAAEQVGLDPYIGFLHGLRPGKPALALDLMEELRPAIGDRLALTLLNRRQVRPEHFETLPGGAVQLTESGRKLVLTEWQRYKQRSLPHRLLGRKVDVALLPSIQARLLARHLRAELPTYLPWTL
ncbi:CRISPR-associated endonuclease Cas4/Cas1 [Nocardia sp. CNY236]|uniref:CRISPR-associated endonuclease Cas4/Cas1 n=1 Tax=Nocardia sp. CNY236 TaxID=1169152 RepID=UPI00041D287A|nr:CRISPR-associated endonuclease Cas4/Cas1 [Nocardia sp. CNY236]